MSTNLRAMQMDVVLEVGNEITTQESLQLLRSALNTLRARTSTDISIADTTSDELSRDLTAREIRAMTLLATKLWLDGQARKYSLSAIKMSNVAGTTNLDGIELALAKRSKELNEELIPLLASLGLDGALDGIELRELGDAADVASGPPGLIGDWSPWWWRA